MPSHHTCGNRMVSRWHPSLGSAARARSAASKSRSYNAALSQTSAMFLAWRESLARIASIVETSGRTSACQWSSISARRAINGASFGQSEMRFARVWAQASERLDCPVGHGQPRRSVVHTLEVEHIVSLGKLVICKCEDGIAFDCLIQEANGLKQALRLRRT